MNPLRLTVPLIAAAALLCGPAQAQEPPTPPETEAEAVRMLASDNYRNRDAAMDFVGRRLRDGLSVGPELRDAMIRALEDPAWSVGRPEIDPELNPDGWGEHWSIYADVVSGMRDPAAVPFMLARRGSPYDLAAIGRPALLPMIEVLEDPEVNIQYEGGFYHTVNVSLRALTLMVHDRIPTEDELERIAAATRYRLSARLPLPAISSAFGLAVTLGTPELLAMVERAANDREAAAAMEESGEELADIVQKGAREALQPGFVPSVIRSRHRHR